MKTAYLIVGALIALVSCRSPFDELPDPPNSFFSLRQEQLSVPRDETDASAGQVNLGYTVVRSLEVLNGERRAPRGILLFHFGGPGTRNSITLQAFLSLLRDDTFIALLDGYILVSLDEIGVGGETFMDCRENYDPVGLSLDDLLEEAQEFASDCRAEFSLIDETETLRVARDIERLRNSLGYETMSFYGISYGAQVALSYATLYPNQTGELILDSPLDPSRALTDRLLEQATGYESALDRFLSWCDTDLSCEFGDGEAHQEYAQWLAELPPTATEASREALLRTTLNLLFREPSWPLLGQLLARIRAGESNFAVPGNSLNPHAFYATTCSDYSSVDRSTLEEFQSQLTTAAPRFGFLFAGEPAPCIYWQAETDRTDWDTAWGDLPPVLISTHPTTPSRRALGRSICSPKYRTAEASRAPARVTRLAFLVSIPAKTRYFVRICKPVIYLKKMLFAPIDHAARYDDFLDESVSVT